MKNTRQLPQLVNVVSDIESVQEASGLPIEDLTLSKYRSLGGQYDGRTLRRLGGYQTIINDAFPEQLKVDYETVEHMRRRRAYVSGLEKKLASRSVTDDLFLSRFNEVAGRLFKDKIVAPAYRVMSGSSERVVNVLLSDLHLHSLLDKREVPLQFGPTEEARRLSAVAVQVAEYKKQYREDTELFVHLLGDIIQGQLHDSRDGATLAEQSCAAIHLLSQMLVFWASQFNRVVVRCTPGNHGRNMARHNERAVNEKFDSIETIIYYGLKKAVGHLGNVSVEIPYTPYFTYDSFGQRAFMTHGDTVLSPGYPGKSIDVSSIRKQINEINGKLSTDQKYSLFAVGHVHVGSITHLPNGAIFMSNGALIPPDAYALSIGNFDTACGQWIWESVDGYIVGDHRFAVVNEYTDKDKSLDKIIKPFEGF